MKLVILPIVFLLTFSTVLPQTKANDLISNGGGRSEWNGYSLDQSIGQHVIGFTESVSGLASQGFLFIGDSVQTSVETPLIQNGVSAWASFYPESREIKLGIKPDAPEYYKIAIYNLRGSRIADIYPGYINDQFETTVDASEFSPGIYVIAVTGKETFQTLKILVHF